MFQLSKKVEYGLIAMRHMASQSVGRLCTTKEIADRHHISYELLAKVMQRLSKRGFIASHHGVHGGYTLTRSPSDITISSVINAIEGKSNMTIIQCEAESPDNCNIHRTCTIKSPLVKLQGNINRMFDNLTLMEMV